jgi:hypothetical protein
MKMVEADGDCLISLYSVGSHGYAQIGWREKGKTRMVLVHRVAWEHLNGPIPEGHVVDHLCRNRRCIRPEHLRLLTNYENARRTHGRDWPLGECVNGHSNDHLVVTKSGKRICRPCRAEWQRTYRAKRGF